MSTVMRVVAVVALSGCMAMEGGAEDDIGQAEQQVGESAALDVYLIMGQSNAVGGASVTSLGTDSSKYSPELAAVPFAQEINCPKSGPFAACELSRGWRGLAPRSGRMGVELSAGRRLHERFGGGVALIKHATNGSNLVTQWDSSGAGRSLWTYANDFIDARMAELPAGSRIAGLFWIQGNGDANLATAAEDYAENLSWLIMRLRQDHGCVPVVIDRLHPSTEYPHADTIRQEQDQVATFVDDVVVVDTGDLALRDIPPQHYAATSFVTLGSRMADAMPTCD